MVRTFATAVRASGGKSAKASRNSNMSINTHPSGDRSNSGGNSVCPRETPTWQKPITSFFTKPLEKELPPEINQIKSQNEPINLGEGSSQMYNFPSTASYEEELDLQYDMELEFENNNGCTEDTLELEMNKENINGNQNNNNEMNNKCEDKKTKVTPAKNKYIEKDEEIRTAKKPKVDFYKHLEEIENNLK